MSDEQVLSVEQVLANISNHASQVLAAMEGQSSDMRRTLTAVQGLEAVITYCGSIAITAPEAAAPPRKGARLSHARDQ